VWRKSDGRCLILKRDEREKVHPGKWAVLGGKLEWKDMPINAPSRHNGDVLDYEDAVENLLVREAKEEANIEIGRELKYINSVAFIRPDGIPVILVKFAAEYLSGDVVPEVGGFTEYAWVTPQEVMDYPCIEGIQQEIVRTNQLYTS
jgi:8-oxo-dGTP pyrophosphatase MutT (NUDIX family)